MGMKVKDERSQMFNVKKTLFNGKQTCMFARVWLLFALTKLPRAHCVIVLRIIELYNKKVEIEERALRFL